MPSTNKTRNLNLNQYIGTDNMKRVDINNDLSKIDEAISGLFKNISFNDGTLTLTKYNNSNLTVSLFNEISNDVKGLTSFNEINGLIDTKLNSVGLDINDVYNFDINAYFKSRLFQTNHTSKINDNTTVGINWQYNNSGIQLGITEEDNPKLYLRNKRNGEWQSWNEIATLESLNNVKTTLEQKITEKINERIGTFDDIWSGL